VADTFTDLTQLLAERKMASAYISEHESRVTHWRNHHDRVARVDAFARGDWHVVFPDSSAVVEMPKVPNIIQLKIDDAAGMASSVIPSVRCDPASERARPRAEKRERIAEFIRAKNRYPLQAARYFIDLMVAGVSYKVVMPDADCARIRRIDPRWAYPDRIWSPDRDVKNLLVAYQASRAVLAQDYPELALEPSKASRKGEADLVSVIEYYDSSEFVRVAEITNPNGTKRAVELKHSKNLLSRVPAVIGARPTFDGQFRGVFDQTLGVLESNNRILNLMLDAAAEMVASQPVEYNMENPEDWGTGAVLHSRSADGFMRRMPPDGPAAQLFAILNQSRSDAREAAVYPEARAGQISQSVASAAFVNAITGNLATEIAHLQRIEAESWGEALSLALEVDEKYLDTGEAKYIIGSQNNKRFSESYKPSEDIKGDYGVRVEFGGAAGGDQFSHEIRLNQAAGNGLISRRTAMEKHSLVEDVVDEEKQLLKEQMLAAGMQFINAQAAQGNFQPGAQFITALDKDSETQLTVLAQLGAITAPPEPQNNAPAGMESFAEASGIARGGGGDTTNVPGVGALPELEELGVAL